MSSTKNQILLFALSILIGLSCGACAADNTNNANANYSANNSNIYSTNSNIYSTNNSNRAVYPSPTPMPTRNNTNMNSNVGSNNNSIEYKGSKPPINTNKPGAPRTHPNHHININRVAGVLSQ
jgi:hypothetical protein